MRALLGANFFWGLREGLAKKAKVHPCAKQVFRAPQVAESMPVAAAMDVAPSQQEESTAQQEEFDLEVCHQIKGLPALSALLVV